MNIPCILEWKLKVPGSCFASFNWWNLGACKFPNFGFPDINKKTGLKFHKLSEWNYDVSFNCIKLHIA